MKKKKNLHTSFIKFLLEKYTDETQRLPEEETEANSLRRNKVRRLEEDEIEVPIDNDDEIIDDEEPIDSDDEIIDELLNEYKRLKRKHGNNKIYNRRKR
jgi:hypothetical protein